MLQGGGVSQTVIAVIQGKEDLAKLSYNLYSGWKSWIHSSSCFIYDIWGGG